MSNLGRLGSVRPSMIYEAKTEQGKDRAFAGKFVVLVCVCVCVSLCVLICEYLCGREGDSPREYI